MYSTVFTHLSPFEQKVPLLLSMGEKELGLKKAILSGEDDLVYLSVMHIEQEAGSSEKGQQAFFELMHAHPEALRLLKVINSPWKWNRLLKMARVEEGFQMRT